MLASSELKAQSSELAHALPPPLQQVPLTLRPRWPLPPRLRVLRLLQLERPATPILHPTPLGQPCMCAASLYVARDVPLPAASSAPARAPRGRVLRVDLDGVLGERGPAQAEAVRVLSMRHAATASMRSRRSRSWAKSSLPRQCSGQGCRLELGKVQA
mmetsp:Transcript_58246/g.137091  ORF Transcript_58246/g.137091 Transcript_58246/m.137091 type:complete len:158 (-) Transcript_58246:696-1169(-)